MYNVTTNEFIEGVNFTYFETYSFQRKGDFAIVDSLFKKIMLEENSLTVQELSKIRKRINELDPYKPHLNNIFTVDNEINPTAEKVYNSTKVKSSNRALIDILKIEISGFDALMCAPVYRDAILFYDKNNTIIDGLNICFECSKIQNVKGKEILADRMCFVNLSEFLKSVGHRIN